LKAITNFGKLPRRFTWHDGLAVGSVTTVIPAAVTGGKNKKRKIKVPDDCCLQSGDALLTDDMGKAEVQHFASALAPPVK